MFSMPMRKPRDHRSLVTLSVTMAAILSGCTTAGSDDTTGGRLPSVASLTATCTGLVGKTIAGVTVTAATRYESKAGLNDAGFCQVQGTRAPFLDIEVDVPDNWSGRLWQQGGGGVDGVVRTALTFDAGGALTAVSPVIAQKAAIYAASNGGNRAKVPDQAAPAVWATGSSDAQLSGDDYAYAAVGTTLSFAKAMSQTFFGAAPQYGYFNGCSNGGRNAYIAAQRWPDDYQGIVAGCETMDMSGQTAAWMNIGSRAGTPAAPSAVQYKAAYAAAAGACDALDGATDGVIANPQACAFDPASLACGAPSASTDPAVCLTAPQLATLLTLLADLKLTDGTFVCAHYSWADFSGFGASFGALGAAFALIATHVAGSPKPPQSGESRRHRHFAASAARRLTGSLPSNRSQSAGCGLCG